MAYAKTKAKLVQFLKSRLNPARLEGMNAVQVDDHLEHVADLMMVQVSKSMTSTWTNLETMVEQATIRPVPLQPGESVQSFIGKDRKNLVIMLRQYWSKLQIEMSKIEEAVDAPGEIKEGQGEPENERQAGTDAGGVLLNFKKAEPAAAAEAADQGQAEKDGPPQA